MFAARLTGLTQIEEDPRRRHTHIVRTSNGLRCAWILHGRLDAKLAAFSPWAQNSQTACVRDMLLPPVAREARR
jgi:hypothetical protein